MGDSFDHGLRQTPGSATEQEEEQDPPFKPLTPEEAQVWRVRNPRMSPWRIVAAQAVLGGLCALVVGLFTHRGSAVWSALYGAGVVVLPGALLAFGMARQKQGADNPAALAVGFLFWELIKIALSVTLLVLAVRVVTDLSWTALLVAMVVCMKLGWLVLLWRRPRQR